MNTRSGLHIAMALAMRSRRPPWLWSAAWAWFFASSAVVKTSRLCQRFHFPTADRMSMPFFSSRHGLLLRTVCLRMSWFPVGHGHAYLCR